MPTYGRYLAEELDDVNGGKWQHAEGLLRGTIERITGCGQAFGIVLFPELSASLAGDYELAFLHDRVLQVCGEYGIRCLDLRGIMAAQGKPTRLWVNPFDGHYGAEANALVANAVVETFGPVWKEAAGNERKPVSCH